MFGQKKSQETAAPHSPERDRSPEEASPREHVSAGQSDKSAQRHPQDKKGVRTPTRREREAARRRPLIVNDPAEAKRRRREARLQESERVREAFRTGDERHLPLKHRGGNRRLIRSVVDERFRISELLIFVTIPFLVISMVFGSNLDVQRIIAYAFYAYMGVVVIEMILLTRTVRQRQASAGLSRQRGDVFYILERAWMFRRLRMPKVGV